MGNYTTFLMFENPRRGRQARNFTENDPKILDLKSSSEQIIFRKLQLGAPDQIRHRNKLLGSFSNDNENFRKAIGLLIKTTSLHVQHAFLYIYLLLLHGYYVKMPNFMFYQGRKQARTKFSFSFLTWVRSPRNQIQ